MDSVFSDLFAVQFKIIPDDGFIELNGVIVMTETCRDKIEASPEILAVKSSPPKTESDKP